MTQLNKAPGRKASFGATMKAVFWSFLGIRKRSDYEKDSASLNPVHVVIAGLIGVMLFIGVLIALVKFAVSGH
ncbi:MAG TPA: DUF2970 domain-containing protein [Telluria sp.]|jgi:hypothetical protein